MADVEDDEDEEDKRESLSANATPCLALFVHASRVQAARGRYETLSTPSDTSPPSTLPLLSSSQSTSTTERCTSASLCTSTYSHNGRRRCVSLLSLLAPPDDDLRRLAIPLLRAHGGRSSLHHGLLRTSPSAPCVRQLTLLVSPRARSSCSPTSSAITSTP